MTAQHDERVVPARSARKNLEFNAEMYQIKNVLKTSFRDSGSKMEEMPPPLFVLVWWVTFVENQWPSIDV